MAVRVRLTRVGSKKNAMWRVVVADQRSPRDGRFIEMIGHYNPQTEPSQIVIDRERLDHWLQRGAEPSETVRKLMRAPNSATGAASGPAAAPPVEDESAAEDERTGDAAEPAGEADLAAQGDAPAAEADASTAAAEAGPAAEGDAPAAEPDAAPAGDEPSESDGESG